MTTFDINKKFILDLLRSIEQGKTQLPEFQRGWVWDDERIRGLLASISLSYPIGAVMMLETGTSKTGFQPRLVEGLTLESSPQPDWLILDGQQRLTSLFQSLLFSQPAITKNARGKEIRRWYYIDICKALDPNVEREDAIIGLPENCIIRNKFGKEIIADYSTSDKEYESSLFPFSQIFDCARWRASYNRFWNYNSENVELFDKFEQAVIQAFNKYQIPLIILHQETPKQAVCDVFEKVNQGGVSLTVFELLTATYASDSYELRKDWEKQQKQLKKYKVLETIENTDFLQAVTLIATRDRKIKSIESGVSPDKSPAISCKRKDILDLSLPDYKKWADEVAKGFIKAAQFLYEQKIFTAIDLPYRTQITPLAAIFAVLGTDADKAGVHAKLRQWYWCGVFGELYGSAIETRLAKDFPEVLEWLNCSSYLPDTITVANFDPNRLLRLRTRTSAAYKGLSALLMYDGGQDFLTGKTIDTAMYFDEKLDIHHIFPKDWCQKNGIDAGRYDSIINKTPISAKTNKIIGKKAPSIYLPILQDKGGTSQEDMDGFLRSHVIDPVSIRKDDFETFFQSRQKALLQRIEKAMGKPIAYETLDLVAAAEYE